MKWHGVVLGVALVGGLSVPVAGQKYGELAGCSDEPQQFHQCARTKAKEFNPPRTPDGKPDFRGHWSRAGVFGTDNIEEHGPGLGDPGGKSLVVDPADGRIPYQPWAAEKAQLHHAQHRQPSKPEYFDPVSRCFEEGVPRMNYQGNMRVLQFPNQIVILHEFNHHYRVIYLDGRPHVGDTLKLWMGDSRGRWEGNTLVVDVTNHNDKTWFDIVGSFHSDAMRVTERWTFTGPDRIDYVATIDDPKVFTQPWKLRVQIGRNKPEEQWESAICEGNKAVHVAFGLPW